MPVCLNLVHFIERGEFWWDEVLASKKQRRMMHCWIVQGSTIPVDAMEERDLQ